MPDDDSVIEFSRSRFRNLVTWFVVLQLIGLIVGLGALAACLLLPWVEPFSWKGLGVEVFAGLLMVVGLGRCLSGLTGWKLIFASTVPSTDYYLLQADRFQRYSREGEVVEEIPFANVSDIEMITQRSDEDPNVKFRVLGITLRDPDDSDTTLDDVYVRWSRRQYQYDLVMSENFFDAPLRSVFKKLRKRWQQWQETHAGEAVRERRQGRLDPIPWYKDWSIHALSALALAAALNAGAGWMPKRAPAGGGAPAPVGGNAPANNAPANNAPANNGPAGAERPPVVAYWPLDEGQGLAVANKAGDAGGGRLRGATWGDGVKGPCVRLDGRSAFVDLGAAALQFGQGAPFTVTGWANKDRETDDGVICSFRNRTTPFPVIEISVRNHQLAGWVRDDTSGQGAAKVSGGSFDDGRWHHVALTRAGDGTVEIFLDGVSQGKGKEQHSGGPITANFNALGCDRVFLTTGKRSPGFFAGSVSEFRVYSRLLSGPEVAAQAKER